MLPRRFAAFMLLQQDAAALALITLYASPPHG